MANDVKWIKIVTDIFDDEKIKFIETMPNGDEIIVIWFKLLCLTGKSNSCGFLMFTNKLAYTEEMLSSIFNRDVKSIQMALQTFEMLEMIEMIDNKIYIANWEKHQSLDKIEKKKLYDREYQKRKRNEKNLLLENRTINRKKIVDNRSLEIEEEIEEEIDIDIKEKDKKETFVSIIDAYASSDALKLALKDYVEMRKKQKGFTIRALKLNLNELDKLAFDEDTKISIIEQSIKNSWKGFYALKSKKQTQNNTTNNVFMQIYEEEFTGE